MALRAAVALALAFTATGVEAGGPNSPDAEAAFTRLQAMEGTWQLAGQPEHGLRITFSTTARGSVLVEEWTWQGQPHSLTLYHRDGESLLATHYCPQGNQPRLALEPGRGEDIRFAFRDATDLDRAQEQVQHALWFRSDGPGHMVRGEIYLDGAGGEHPQELTLERVTEG